MIGYHAIIAAIFLAADYGGKWWKVGAHTRIGWWRWRSRLIPSERRPVLRGGHTTPARFEITLLPRPDG